MVASSTAPTCLHQPVLSMTWRAVRAGGVGLVLSLPMLVHATTGVIYTCVDAQGRTLTSDRPILACIDRPQRILGAETGHEKGVLPPSYTEEERAQLRREEQERLERQREERDLRQRHRILLMRYPDKTSHDRARTAAKEQVGQVVATAETRLEELHQLQQKFQQELEFYAGDASKAPAALRRRLDENRQDIAEQEKLIANQQTEQQRIDSMYDAELQTLEQLWATGR
ncbi:protein of unknown function [Lampropedia hyalina DSM 16112]|uniref:DUF4124 domain-containing protein n=2 Tax=Lampropedia TaxID=198705 RepID=A0A1M4V353_9BURK|nr:protein of unknown function [Lampropedia hyalina DSM 16112]